MQFPNPCKSLSGSPFWADTRHISEPEWRHCKAEGPCCSPCLLLWLHLSPFSHRLCVLTRRHPDFPLHQFTWCLLWSFSCSWSIYLLILSSIPRQNWTEFLLIFSFLVIIMTTMHQWLMLMYTLLCTSSKHPLHILTKIVLMAILYSTYCDYPRFIDEWTNT